MAEIKDKNGTRLKIGDKIENIKGEVRTLENINGVSAAVLKEHKIGDKKYLFLSKINWKEWELVR